MKANDKKIIISTGSFFLVVAIISTHYEIFDDFIRGVLFGIAIAFELLGILINRKTSS